VNPITPHQSAPPLVHQGHTRRLATLRPDTLECFETHCHDAGHSECPCRVTKAVLENPSQKWLKNGILSLNIMDALLTTYIYQDYLDLGVLTNG
jgi:hypothetical protein